MRLQNYGHSEGTKPRFSDNTFVLLSVYVHTTNFEIEKLPSWLIGPLNSGYVRDAP